MSSVADYVGRTVDLTAFHGADPDSNRVLLIQTLVDELGGSVVTGIQKLAQTFLIQLFKIRDPDGLDPNEGCQFIRDAIQGGWRQTADVTQSFYASLIDIARNFSVKENRQTFPDDERYQSAVIDSIILDGDRVAVSITLTSQAGSTFNFIAPIPILPGRVS